MTRPTADRREFKPSPGHTTGNSVRSPFTLHDSGGLGRRSTIRNFPMSISFHELSHLTVRRCSSTGFEGLPIFRAPLNLRTTHLDQHFPKSVTTGPINAVRKRDPRSVSLRNALHISPFEDAQSMKVFKACEMPVLKKFQLFHTVFPKLLWPPKHPSHLYPF